MYIVLQRLDIVLIYLVQFDYQLRYLQTLGNVEERVSQALEEESGRTEELKNLFEEEIPALVPSTEASDFEGEQMRAKIANVSCEDSFSETSELEKTVYDDHEELSSAFQSTVVEHLTDSDNDLDEEGKMEIDIEENGENILSDIAEWASKYLITHQP